MKNRSISLLFKPRAVNQKVNIQHTASVSTAGVQPETVSDSYLVHTKEIYKPTASVELEKECQQDASRDTEGLDLQAGTVGSEKVDLSLCYKV